MAEHECEIAAAEARAPQHVRRRDVGGRERRELDVDRARPPDREPVPGQDHAHRPRADVDADGRDLRPERAEPLDELALQSYQDGELIEQIREGKVTPEALLVLAGMAQQSGAVREALVAEIKSSDINRRVGAAVVVGIMRDPPADVFALPLAAMLAELTQHLLVVTNHAVATLSAALVSLVYRRRWSIELFFRWIKCTLGCRHFLAESPRGVALQLYLALIASVLIYLYTGQRAPRRVMEMLQFYLMGWAELEDLMAAIARANAARAKTNR